MKTAVCAGSFDPVTLGHLDVICRAAELFDRVYVCAVVNSEKSHGLFTPQQRLCLLKKALQHLPADKKYADSTTDSLSYE